MKESELLSLIKEMSTEYRKVHDIIMEPPRKGAVSTWDILRRENLLENLIPLQKALLSANEIFYKCEDLLENETGPYTEVLL